MSTNCLVGSPFDNSKKTKLTPFEYWYGVEATTNDIESVRYDLEGAIYNAAIKNMVWCTDSGNRRVEEVNGETYYVDDQERRLGIMAISSAPIDVLLTDSSCSDAAMKTDEANCFLFKGVMSLMSYETDDVSTSIAYLRQEIQDAMDSGAFLDSQGRGEGDLSSVITGVTYLGASDPTVRTGFIAPTNPNPPVVSEGVKSIASTDNSDQGNNNYAPIMAASFFAAGAVMLLGLFVAKRRQTSTRSAPKEVKPPPSTPVTDDDTFGGGTIASYHEDEDEMITSPPPPSECDLRAQALEAERKYAQEKGLGTIPEDATYYSDQNTIEMIAADQSRLGSCHSSHSPNYTQCSKESVVFIPRDWEPEVTPSDDGHGDGSSSQAIV